jgi:hypothetical protein
MSLDDILGNYLPYYMLRQIDEYMSIGNNPKKWYDLQLKKHRIYDEPAYMKCDGVTMIRRWYQHGNIHRLFKPAQIMDSNDKHIEVWYQNNEIHRILGPAITEYRNGLLHREQWVEHDIPHRLDDPSTILYYQGKPIHLVWVEYGTFVTSRNL